MDEIRKISKSMGSIYWLLISGGEPFLREDLSKICQVFCHKNNVVNLQIPTNGYFLETIEEQTRKILSSCSKTKVIIIVSVDGIGKDHDFIRGVKGSFYRLKETIKRLHALKEQYHNLATGVNITVSVYNQYKLVNICKYVERELHVDNINLTLTRGHPRCPESKEVNINCYENATKHLQNLHRYKYYNFINSKIATAKDIIQNEIILRTVREQRRIIPCYAGTLSAVLDETGNVYPCELLSHSMGNLRDNNYDFKKVWTSPRAQEIRQFIKSGRCYCTYECALTTSILLNPRHYPSLIRKSIFGRF